MSASTSSSDAAPRTLASAGLPRRVRRVLEMALTLVADELDAFLGAMLAEFEQDLFRMADLARNPGAESGYMQTLRTLRLNRADLIPRFMIELEAGLAAIRSGAAGRAAAVAESHPSFRNLTLVEDNVLDEGTVLREIASRQEGKSTLALHLLGQRFGVLAGTPAFDGERLPLGPQALCRAMRNASQTLQVTYDARLLLYRIFDRQVMSKYARIVEKLDETIAAEGVLPGLTFVPVRTRATAQNAPDKPDAPATGDSGIAKDGPVAARPATERGKPFADAGGKPPRLPTVPAPQRPAHTADAQRPHTAWMGQDDLPGDASDEEAASLELLQQLMSGRRELIDKLRPGAAKGPRRELPTGDILSALGVLQRQAPSPGAAPTLHDVRQGLLAQARQLGGQGATLSQRDNDTFELLTMFYGQIEEQIHDDAPASALIRRLQLPLLRLALQDRAFFVRRHHPARRLLNTVAESAAKWLDKDDFDPAFLVPLQQAVTHVVDRYDGDDHVFTESNAQLETLLETQVRKAEVLERRHVEAARGKEKLEVAKLRASETLEQLVGEQRLPKFVRALLNQAWADVLTLTLLRQGGESDEWRKQVDATRGIVAACSRAGAPLDAALRDHIESALSQVGYHADEAAVIAQRLTSSVPDDEDDAASRTELTVKLKARARLGEDAAKARRPQLPPRTPEEQTRYDQLRVLPFGTWIEFVTNQQGDTVRRRLSWFSPVTDNALFVNQRGQRSGEQSLDSLARMVAAGQARIVTSERGRLVDRAWQAAVSALRSFAGRGDGAPLPEGAT